MKNRQIMLALCTYVLLLFSTNKSYAQDLLNPIDSYGNSWFQTQAQKNIFLTAVFTQMKSACVSSNSIKTFLDDTLISLIKKDVDLVDNNGNETLQNVIVVKSSNSTASNATYSTNDNNSTNRYPLMLYLFIGNNFNAASLTVNQNVPAASWGAELTDNNYTVDLVAINAGRANWLYINTGLQITLEQVNISGT